MKCLDPGKKEGLIRKPLQGRTNRLPGSAIADNHKARVYDVGAWADGSLVPVVEPFDRLLAEMDGFSVENLPLADAGFSERLRKISALVTIVANGRGEPDPAQLGMAWVALTVVCGEYRFASPLSLNRYAEILGVHTELLSRRVERMAELLNLPNPCEWSAEHRRNFSAARRRRLAEKAKGAA